MAIKSLQIDNDRLRILGLVQSDQGVYTCLAQNDVGSIAASAQLIVEREGLLKCLLKVFPSTIHHAHVTCPHRIPIPDLSAA